MKTSANKNTQKYERILAMFRSFAGRNLWDVYTTFSRAKEQAYNECLRKCYDMNGENFHITSANTFGFSVGWETETHIFIETPKNSYVIEK